MSHQNHDIGWRKRLAALAARLEDAEPTPGRLARELVRRGLASPLILDTYSRPRETNDQ